MLGDVYLCASSEVYRNGGYDHVFDTPYFGVRACVYLHCLVRGVINMGQIHTVHARPFFILIDPFSYDMCNIVS